MGCFVPFNNRNLDISLFAFRPMVVLVDELMAALKHFSLSTETLGCVHSAIFRSIHGNMIIWYGAWMKGSNENKELLSATLLSMLENLSSMAILIDHSFFESYAGESRYGAPAAKLSTGDIISINTVLLDKDDKDDLAYACLAIFRSHFAKMDGVISGVCLKCPSQPRTLNLFVWKSLQLCYSWILTADYRKIVLPYLDNIPIEFKYDIFRVVFVGGNNALNLQSSPLHRKLENMVEIKGESKVIQEGEQAAEL